LALKLARKTHALIGRSPPATRYTIAMLEIITRPSNFNAVQELVAAGYAEPLAANLCGARITHSKQLETHFPVYCHSSN